MQTLNQFQDLFEQYLADNQYTRTPIELYAPVSYIMGLGGKRLRPALLIMSYSLFDDKVESSLPPAMAIEVFHNFTLVHDDIMDSAPLRRGKKTVHMAYDLNTGILSGDVMLALAYEQLLKIEDKTKIPELLSTFTKTAIEVCEGQQMDMNFERQKVVSIPEYLKMIELKTSVLVACTLKMGAQLAGAPASDADNLYEFGKNLGIAFQLQDDLLDTFGHPDKFGKKVGGDIAQNKKTYLYLKALELGNQSQKLKLTDLYSSSTTDETNKIKEVSAIYQQLNIRKETENAMDVYSGKALKALEMLSVVDEKKDMLRQFAINLMQRES